MSETRPPITAGPIERAFRFLKRTSISSGGVGDRVGVGDDGKDTVAVGDAVAQNDQYYGVDVGRYNTWRVRGSFSEIPHVFTSTYH